jgi:GR25 family glycosyltransferase involved in LPS biosynthesis
VKSFYDVPRIEVESWETDKNYGLERGQASPTKLAELLSYYYNNREELDKAGQWCRNELLQDKYKWTTIVNQLEGIITRTLAEKPRREMVSEKSRRNGVNALFPRTSSSIVDLSQGPVYGMSIKGDERREPFEQRLAELQQSFQWWNAIDGRGMSRAEMEAMTERRVIWDKRGGDDALKRTGELALTLSSIELWKHALKEGYEHLAILEDDTTLRAPIAMPVPDDADLVFFNNRSFRNHNGLTWGGVCGTDGYLVTKQGMEKLLDIFETIFMPLDLQMLVQMESMHQCQHHLVEWYQADKPMLRSYTAPPLAFHNNSSSRIR